MTVIATKVCGRQCPIVTAYTLNLHFVHLAGDKCGGSLILPSLVGVILQTKLAANRWIISKSQIRKIAIL